MVSHHKHHWQALSRVGTAWETGLAAEELRRHLPGDELPPSPGGPWTGGFPGAAKPGTQVRFVQFSRARKVHVSNIQGNRCLVCLSTGAQKEVRPVCHQYPAIQSCPGKLLMGLCGKTSSGMFFWPAGKGQHRLLQSEGCHSTEVPHVTAGAARQAAGRAGVQELGLQPTCPSDTRQFWALKPFLCVMGHGQGQLRGPLPEEALGPHFCVTAHGAGSL